MTVGVGKHGKFAIVLDHFVTEENLIDNLVVRAGVLEEVVVHVAATCGVDSHEVTSPLVLLDGLSHVLFVLQVGRLLQWFEQS